MYLISACLVGVNCKYSGGNNECQWVKEFVDGKDCMLVCPEALGELPTPRPPAEFIDGKVIDKNGKDVTDNFIRGAEKTVEQAEKKAAESGKEIRLAILKANSPSCGCGKIYDGTFSGVLIDGDGLLTTMLKKKGILVITEQQKAEADQFNMTNQ